MGNDRRLDANLGRPGYGHLDLYIVLLYIVLLYIVLLYIVLLYIVLLYIVLLYIVLLYIVLLYIAFLLDVRKFDFDLVTEGPRQPSATAY